MAESYGTIREGDSFTVEIDFTDDDGSAFVPTTLAVTLYDDVTKEIINSRNASNLTPVSTYISAGTLSFDFAVADAALIDSTKKFEIHVAEFLMTWSSAPTKTRTLEVVHTLKAKRDLTT